MEKIKKNGDARNGIEPENQHAEIAEDQVLTQMAQEEEGEFNQPEELVDDITHLRNSKTRRG